MAVRERGDECATLSDALRMNPDERASTVDVADRAPPRRPRTWGLRFSALDGAVLLLGAAATWGAWPIAPELAPAIPFALGHFFLFCNVFRVRRAPELVWAATFVVNLGARLALGDASWAGVCATQLPLTAYLLWRETRKPWYHGIFARRWNPDHLDDYLAGRV